jgi:flagellar basal body L-ring protein FlgH
MKQRWLSPLFGILLGLQLRGKKPPAPIPPTLDQHVQEVKEKSRQLSSATPGSLYFSNGRLADNFRDVRASQVYDLVTIVVLDNSSAVSTGVTNTARKSSVSAPSLHWPDQKAQRAR